MDEIQGVQYEGILAHGYGLIPKLVTRDKKLSIEAKAIYAYLAAFAGNTQQAFPGVSLICDELNISKKRYLSHRKALIDRGYIEIKRERKDDGNGFSKNIYVLKQNIPYGVDSLPYETLPYQNVGLGGVTVQNDATISNNSTSNSSINNSIKKEQREEREEETPPSPVIDKDFKTLQTFFDENIGKRNFTTDKELSSLMDDFKDPLLIGEALKIAAVKGKPLFTYAAGVLRKMSEEKGVTTYEQFKQRAEQAKQAPSLADRATSKATEFGGHTLPF